MKSPVADYAHTVPPPNTAPPLTASPNIIVDFQVQKSYGYMTPFTAVFPSRRFFACPESGGIGGVDCKTMASFKDNNGLS